MCKESYLQYIIGKKEDYLLTDTEINNCFENACLIYTQQILDEMVELGLVDTVEENGEILYKLTENGEIEYQSINN